jgi:phage terminase Nu1 subunit (DNA packaging protein)
LTMNDHDTRVPRGCGMADTLDRMTVDQSEAARLSGLSSKTLGRLADRGETVGRLKVGRKVLFHVASLSAWLAARAAGTSPRRGAEGGGQ